MNMDYRKSLLRFIMSNGIYYFDFYEVNFIPNKNLFVKVLYLWKYLYITLILSYVHIFDSILLTDNGLSCENQHDNLSMRRG